MASLLRRLPRTGFQKWWLIVQCGRSGLREAIPEILESFDATGKNVRDIRSASLAALNKLLDPEPRTSFLIGALDDKDTAIAESAAIQIGASQDPIVVGPLLQWLEQRLQQPRSKSQAHRTVEAIAACVRLGSDEQTARLQMISAGIKLTDLERKALDGTYSGQAFQPEFPVISWPS